MGGTSSSTLELILKAIDQASPTLGKIAGSMRSQGVQAGVSAAITSKAFGLAGEALHKVVDIVDDSVRAYQEQQIAQGRLTASLNANVPAWQAHTDELKAASQAAVNLGFSDNNATDAMSRLVVATHDVGKASEILSTAEDLARFKSISLADASEALTKVEAGSYKILKSLGIELKAGATQTDALAAVQKAAGGQARAYAETDLGKVQVASAKVEQAQEKMGAAVSKVESVVLPAAADMLTDFVNKLDDAAVALDSHSSMVDKDRAALDGLTNSQFANTAGGIAARQAIEDDIATREKWNNVIIDGTLKSEDLDQAQYKLNQTVAAADAPTTALTQDLTKTYDAAALLKTQIDLLTTAVDQGLFGKAITDGHAAQLRANIADLEKQRSKTKAGSDAFKILTGEIASNQEELFNLGLQQADAKGPTAALSYLKQQIAKFGDASGAAKALVAQYQALADAEATAMTNFKLFASTTKYKNLPTYASGGFAKAGQPAIVGENGPELIVPRGGGVDVIPQAQWGGYGPDGGGWGGGGTPVELPVVIDGREIGRVVDQRLYLSLAGAGGSSRPR